MKPSQPHQIEMVSFKPRPLYYRNLSAQKTGFVTEAFRTLSKTENRLPSPETLLLPSRNPAVV
jgi:hypothetical protein